MDQIYIDALASNDSVLIKEIYQKCFGNIKKMIEQNNGNEDDAKDVFQEAMIAIFYKANTKTFRLTCSICAFIYLICKRKWMNELKKRKSIRLTFFDTSGYSYTEDTIKIIDEVLKAEAQMKLVDKCFSKLSASCQEMIALSYGDRMMKEVAEILKKTHGAVRMAKCECMKKLVELVQRDTDFKNDMV